MLKIGQSVENTGLNTIIRKSFQRGLQTIEATVAKIGDKTYYKSWVISEYGHKKKISMSYNSGHPIKGSKSVVDFYA